MPERRPPPKNTPPKNTEEFDEKLLDVLICPVAGCPLTYDRKKQRLISKKAKLAYPIRDGIAIMLAEEAEKLD